MAKSPRLDLWETTLIVVAVAGLVWVLAITRAQQMLRNGPTRFASLNDEQLDAELAHRYGPTHHSLGVEEWLIRDFFKDKRDGVFADVGAWHWETGSNTYFLEHDLGWKGLAIDASPEFADGWRQHRPGSRFVVAFVDAVDGASREFFEGKNSLTNSSRRDVPDQYGGGTVGETHVRTARFDTLLEAAGIQRLDFVSMDIELSEPQALAGFSISRYKPSLVCIEDHMPVRQAILSYFASAGYVVVGKYLRYDLENLYFAPAELLTAAPTRPAP
jgi:hypothetical protein